MAKGKKRNFNQPRNKATGVTPEFVEMIKDKKAKVIFDILRKKFVTGEEEFSVENVVTLAENITNDMDVVNKVVELFGDKTPVKEVHALVGKSISMKTKGGVKVNDPEPEAEEVQEYLDELEDDRFASMADENDSSEESSS